MYKYIYIYIYIHIYQSALAEVEVWVSAMPLAWDWQTHLKAKLISNSSLGAAATGHNQRPLTHGPGGLFTQHTVGLGQQVSSNLPLSLRVVLIPDIGNLGMVPVHWHSDFSASIDDFWSSDFARNDEGNAALPGSTSSCDKQLILSPMARPC